MTLERFGFIGTDKKCFWGMVGVKWITPLKVEQIPVGGKAAATTGVQTKATTKK